jgi:hypothetical protein
MLNPKNSTSKQKTDCIHRNIYEGGYGMYKACPFFISIKFKYVRDYDPGISSNICKVFVVNKHPIDVIMQIALDKVDPNKPLPLMVYPMGRDFTGINFESREGIFDEMVVLRTNYAPVIKKNPVIFSSKADDEVIYTKIITTIRDMNYNFMNYDQLVKQACITVFPQENVRTIEDVDDEGDKTEILTGKHLLKFQILIETIFQAAIYGYHDVLILTLFTEEFNIPLDDQIMIYNFCILKYGHKFKDIVIAIPSYEGAELAKYFNKHIVKPFELVSQVDIRYQTEMVKNEMIEKSAQNEKNGKSLMSQMIQMTPEEKMNIMREMMKNKKNIQSKKKSD